MTPKEAKKFIGKLVETEYGIGFLLGESEWETTSDGGTKYAAECEGDGFNCYQLTPIYRDDPRLSDREEKS